MNGNDEVSADKCWYIGACVYVYIYVCVCVCMCVCVRLKRCGIC